MNINFDAVILDQRGKPMLASSEGEETVKLGAIAEQALLAAYADENGLPAGEKVRRYKLFNKVSVGGEIDITAEEVTLLKQCIGKGYPPLIVGRAYDLIEPGAEA